MMDTDKVSFDNDGDRYQVMIGSTTWGHWFEDGYDTIGEAYKTINTINRYLNEPEDFDGSYLGSGCFELNRGEEGEINGKVGADCMECWFYINENDLISIRDFFADFIVASVRKQKDFIT